MKHRFLVHFLHILKYSMLDLLLHSNGNVAVATENNSYGIPQNFLHRHENNQLRIYDPASDRTHSSQLGWFFPSAMTETDTGEVYVPYWNSAPLVPGN